RDTRMTTARHCPHTNRKNAIRRERNQLRSLLANLGGIGRGPAHIELYVATDAPARLLQLLLKCPNASLKLRIVRSGGQEHADAPHPLPPLRARRRRPRDYPAAGEGDEFPPPHGAYPKAKDQGRSIAGLGVVARWAAGRGCRA